MLPDQTTFKDDGLRLPPDAPKLKRPSTP
jgi:hypothetical protein